MQISLLEFPRPIMTIDDFFPTEKAQEILDEAISLKGVYRPARVQNGGSVIDPKLRQNDIVYLDQVFDQNRSGSKILSAIVPESTPDTLSVVRAGESVYGNERLKIWQKGSTIFDVIRLSTHSETILSRYGNCDFYGWHTDATIGSFMHPQRIVTLVYYVNTEPEQFTGGAITFKHIDEEKKEHTISVTPKHNRAVLFQTDLLHTVENVRLLGDNFADGRFSLNCWFGFKS